MSSKLYAVLRLNNMQYVPFVDPKFSKISLGNRPPKELPTDFIVSAVITFHPNFANLYNKCYNAFDRKNKMQVSENQLSGSAPDSIS